MKYYERPSSRQRSKTRVSPMRVLMLCFAVLLTLGLIATAVILGIKPEKKTAGDATLSGGTSSESSSVPVISQAPKSTLATGASIESSIENGDVFTAEATISMVGDVLLHQRMRNAGLVSGTSYDYSSYFSEIKYHFDKVDFNIFNMEGPIDAKGDNKGLASYPCFNYPYQLAANLKDAGFHAAITSNNHAFDQGWNGLLSTRKHLMDNDIDVLGTYENQQQFDEFYIREIKGVKVGVLAYSALDNGMSSAVGNHVAYAMPRFKDNNTDDVPKMIDKVNDLRDAGAEFVVMALHWGSEYVDKPSAMQKQIAQKLVEGGVDVIMGDHSHCPQPIEVREVNRGGFSRKALIVYSTGNFCSDQTALNPPLAKTQEGLLVSVGISRDSAGAYISAASYIPTLCYPDEMWRANGQPVGYRILPAGRYAQATSKPDGISSNVWQKCKNAWDRVPKLVGTQIDCLPE